MRVSVYPRILEVFLQRGININAVDKDGNTALMKAVEGFQVDNIQKLLENGADVSKKNNKDQTALFVAQKKNFVLAIDLLKKYS